MFSVIIPLYNKEQSIKNTIDSVLQQSFQYFEIVLINDGSTDRSLQAVCEIDDSRICIINKPNGGVSSARNLGIKTARYPWITFLDADDLWESNHLSVLAGMIESYPTENVFCTSYIRSDNFKASKSIDKSFVVEDYFKETMKQSFFWTSIACIHKAVFQEVGLFLEGFNRGEDLEMWQRIARENKFVRSLYVTAIYRVDSENKLTEAKYNYNKSTISTVHKRVTYYVSQTERKFYLKSLLKAIKSYIRKGDFISGFRTVYRLFILMMRKVR